MNYCSNCGNQLAETVTFCSKCGTKVTVGKSTNIDSVKSVSTNKSVNNDEVQEILSNTFSKARETVKNNQFFHYFVTTVKHPTSEISSGSQSFGWIQVILLATITTLSLYSIFKGAIKIELNELGLSSLLDINSSVMSSVRDELVPRVFLASLVVYLTFIASAFLVLKFTSKSEQTFSGMLTDFGGLFTPNIIILLVTSILTILFASPVNLAIAIGLVVLSFLLCFVAYNFYLFNHVSIDGLDKMYVLLVSNIIVLLILFALLYIQIEPMITVFNDIVNMINNFLW